jgi:hypothetical protein
MSNLTPGMCRPAPDQTIKTYSPTQGDTQEKAPHLGSATMPLLDTMGGGLETQVAFGKFFNKANYTQLSKKGVTYHERRKNQ